MNFRFSKEYDQGILCASGYILDLLITEALFVLLFISNKHIGADERRKKQNKQINQDNPNLNSLSGCPAWDCLER